MAKLSATERDVIIDEIYEQVSIPIIEANEKLIENAKYDKNLPYFKDVEKYNKLKEERAEITEKMDKIEAKYNHASIGGFKLHYYNPMGQSENVISHLKLENVTLAKYPTKQDIQKEIILSGNKDIPELIETIVNKLKGDN